VTPADPGRAADLRAPLELVALVAILGCVVVVAAVLVANTGQLGFDEAIYAVKARSYVGGSEVDFWAPFRPPGLAVLGTLAAPAGFTDASIRAVTVIAALGTLTMVWVVARQLWGAAAALFALLGTIGAPVFVSELPLFHNDILSVGLLLLLMWIVWNQLQTRPAPTRMFLLAAPVAAATFYVRYGNLGPIVAIGLATLLLFGPRLIRHIRLVAVTVLIGVLLLVPHVVESIARTGSPLGALVSAGAVANTTSTLGSVRAYFDWLPDQLLGWIPLAMAIVGVAHGALAALAFATRRTNAEDLRRQAWLLVPAIVAGALIVYLSHPERRYQLFPITLLLVSGAGAIATGIARLSSSKVAGRPGPSVRVAGIIVATGVLVLWAGYNLSREVGRLFAREPPRGWEVAGRRIVDDGGGPCSAVSSVAPILAWYSHCRIVDINQKPPVDGSSAGGGRTYVVFNDLDPERATPEALAAYRELVRNATPLPIADRSRGIEIYRLP
jgi:dolichyl-phosphate-mannose-protein mannosyltransferase